MASRQITPHPGSNTGFAASALLAAYSPAAVQASWAMANAALQAKGAALTALQEQLELERAQAAAASNAALAAVGGCPPTTTAAAEAELVVLRQELAATQQQLAAERKQRGGIKAQLAAVAGQLGDARQAQDRALGDLAQVDAAFCDLRRENEEVRCFSWL